MRLRAGLGLLAVALLAGSGRPADASIYNVGDDPATCDYPDLQTAINLVKVDPDAELHVTSHNGGFWTQLALHIDNQVLHIVGGFADCTQTLSSGITTLSGAGGSNDSVILITGQSDIVLDGLTIRDGDEVYDGYGGGVDFQGSGTLTIRNSSIINNYAGYGAGVNVIAGANGAQLRIEANTVISGNIAQFSGGGIRVSGDTYLKMLSDQTTVWNNTALGINPVSTNPQGGYGGGVEVVEPAQADIASPGYGNLAAIEGNLATRGGGLALVIDDGNHSAPLVRLYSTDSSRPVRIHDNRATLEGGGVFVDAYADGIFDIAHQEGLFCAADFTIDENKAADGAAIYARGDYGQLEAPSAGGVVLLNVPLLLDTYHTCDKTLEQEAVQCSAGPSCNALNGNRAESANEQPTNGAIIALEHTTNFAAHRVQLRANAGGRVLHANNDAATVSLDNCLIVGNQLTQELVYAEGTNSFYTARIGNCTIADNAVGSPNLILVDDGLTLISLIVDQPGNNLMVSNGGVVTKEYVLSTGAGGTIIADPRFIDPGNGDYHLQAASVAVDAAIPFSGTDLDGNQRTVGMPLAKNSIYETNTTDLGAYERPTLFPLVLNGQFDVDRRLWNDLHSGTTWDGTQNVSGLNASSGSWKVDKSLDSGLATPKEFLAGSQCVFLPGPALYELDGYGRNARVIDRFTGADTDNDTVRLLWEFRSNGGACADGPADASGVVVLSTSSSWTFGANPGLIGVAADQWTSNSSITIYLSVLDNDSVIPRRFRAWFDGIQLYTLAGDWIFANGFD